ncbi:MAG: hypothetical protein RIR01_1876 [Bacteroidota bacterium]|jgi:hypothetical protein
MKTKKEIEQLAFLEYPRLINDPYNPMEDGNTYERQIWIDGYTQCQEDMKEYIFEVAFQFHRLGKYYGNISDTHFTDIYEETIKSINKP